MSEIFRILSDPKAHTHLDGSGMLRGAESDELITGVGDVFVMNMYFPALGDYQMDNHVVEFEFDGRIGWEPVAGRGHPGIGTQMGHRWSFVLTPDGPDATIVVEIYDCTNTPAEFRKEMENGTMWIGAMDATLERLEGLVRASK